MSGLKPLDPNWAFRDEHGYVSRAKKMARAIRRETTNVCGDCAHYSAMVSQCTKHTFTALFGSITSPSFAVRSLRVLRADAAACRDWQEK